MRSRKRIGSRFMLGSRSVTSYEDEYVTVVLISGCTDHATIGDEYRHSQ